jgi:hypothetical protein
MMAWTSPGLDLQAEVFKNRLAVHARVEDYEFPAVSILF